MAFTQQEKQVLSNYFTNTDEHIFALVNLPEVIKGTLISRYSRSNKDMRRLFLDEFYTHENLKDVLNVGGETRGSTQALRLSKAEDFYERILLGFGDDSVAELGGAHVGIEQISMLAAKELEERRIGLSPLEVSSRYVYLDQKPGGHYRYYRDPNVMASSYGMDYVRACDGLFSAYSRLVRELQKPLAELYPGDMTDTAYRFSIRAKACDIARNLLPLASYTRMGIFGNGRAFEYLLLNLSSHRLCEMRKIGRGLERNLKPVIPAFIKRVNGEKGDAFRQYRGSREADLEKWAGCVADNVTRGGSHPKERVCVRLVDYDRDAEEKILSALLFSHSSLSYRTCKSIVSKLSEKERKKVWTVCVGHRKTRHHKPPREFEDADFSFEVTADWGVYKDLQRHRLLTRHRQIFTNNLGYRIPEELEQSSLRDIYVSAQEQAAEVYDRTASEMPDEAQYIVTHGALNRFYMRMNLREAVHLTELRSTPQGHPWYREVAQEIAREITKVMPVLGPLVFPFVDYQKYHLERLSAFQKLLKKAERKGVTVFAE